MLVATGTDLRPNLERITQLGGGELVLEGRTFTVPGGYHWAPPDGSSIRAEHGKTRIHIVGHGDFTIGTRDPQAGEVRNFRMDGALITSDAGRNGWALRLQRCVRSVLRDVTVDPVEVGWRNQFGIWVNGFDDVTLDNVTANARTKSLLVNGSKKGWGADFYLVGGSKFTTFRDPKEPSAGEVAIHIAGNAGGVHLTSADVIHSGIGLLVDDAMTPGVLNKELFFGDGLFFDSCAEDCMRFGPKAATSATFSGTWMATAGLGGGDGNGLRVHHDNGQLTGNLSGVIVKNNRGTGVAISGGQWIVGGASVIAQNGGFGLHKANKNCVVQRGSILGFNNAKGTFGGF